MAATIHDTAERVGSPAVQGRMNGSILFHSRQHARIQTNH